MRFRPDSRESFQRVLLAGFDDLVGVLCGSGFEGGSSPFGASRPLRVRAMRLSRVGASLTATLMAR